MAFQISHPQSEKLLSGSNTSPLPTVIRKTGALGGIVDNPVNEMSALLDRIKFMFSPSGSTFSIAVTISAVLLFSATSVWKRLADRRLSEEKSLNKSFKDVKIRGDGVVEHVTSRDIERHIQKRAHDAERIQLWMAFVVTIAVASAALYIILSDHYGEDSLKWAYGAIGTVIGYWLKR